MIEKMLEGAGLDVVTAHDGLEAIEKAFAGDVNLIILDVMMPRMNGYQACRLLKNEPTTKTIPVVILTSKDQAGDRFWGLETGAILDLVRSVLRADEGTPRPRPHEGGHKAQSGVDILSRVNELLDRKLYEATILTEIGRVARSLVHFDETFTSVMGIVARVVDFTVGAMAFAEADDLDVVMMLNHAAAPSVIEEHKARLMEAIVRERGASPSGKVQARLFTPLTVDPTVTPETALGGFASFPIATANRLTGLLAVGGKTVTRMGVESEAFLVQVANQAHIVVENSRLFDRIKNLSIRDGLTELYNHRHSMALVSQEFERVGRYQEWLSILMVDIDHFKRVNDEHGHQAGDAILRDVARLLKETLRTVDSLGRYGGEEFMAVLPHTAYDEAKRTGERLRRAVEEHTFRVAEKKIKVTISIGVAAYPSEAVDTPNGLIREADRSLYKAKEAGRNRVA
jgi:two-component system cell cycle response regulator